MLGQVKTNFLTEMKPIIIELADQWFPPDQKTPDGQYYYACTYCDMECGRHERHDEDCLYQMAKNTIKEWESIDKETKWDLNWRKEPRDPKEIEDFREWAKYHAIFEKFIVSASTFVPLDFSDPVNKGVICSCVMVDKNIDKHHPKCPYVRVARALNKLYKRTGPRIISESLPSDE